MACVIFTQLSYSQFGEPKYSPRKFSRLTCNFSQWGSLVQTPILSLKARSLSGNGGSEVQYGHEHGQMRHRCINVDAPEA
jgi:hypothetical protein